MYYLITYFTTLPLLCLFNIAQATNTTEPGKFIVEPATLTCLGFEWHIKGDDNRNAKALVYYKESTGSTWNEAMPLLRIGNEKSGVSEWNYTTPNMFAGSIFDLKANTEYECKFILKDPDGVNGIEEKIIKVKTRSIPTESEGGEIRHVYPKNYEGKKVEPAYEGLLHAYYGYKRYADWILTADAIQPGDKIIMHAGTYKADYKDYRDFYGVTFDGTYRLTQDGTKDLPIVIKAAGDGDVIIDGNGTARLFDLTAADHHYIDGITFKNTEVAICAGLMNIIGSDGLVVRNCHFEDIGIGIQAQYEQSKNFYIADNTFIGREDPEVMRGARMEKDRPWVQRIFSYYAIKVHGQGHVICHNSISYFFDGIDICTHCCAENEQHKKSISIDIYNNDIFLCNDNFIEADGATHNVRIFRNRAINCYRDGFSNQPVLGGPVYWIRNISYNTPEKPAMKWWMNPAGVYVLHNTFSTYTGKSEKAVSNVHIYNNLFLPPDDCEYPVINHYSYTGYSNSDYNGYRYKKPFAHWFQPKSGADFTEEMKAQSFESLDALQQATGQEEHSVLVSYDDFVMFPEPAFKAFAESNKPYKMPVYHVEQLDFRLKPNSTPVDKGKQIPNINDDYKGDAPDLGALELGHKKPIYGPRKE